MGKYKMIVLTDPLDGQEDEFNRWYSDEHLRDVVSIDGFVGVQRFKLHSNVSGESPNKYLAIYDMETDDPDAVIDRLKADCASQKIVISATLNSETEICCVFESYSDAAERDGC